MFLLDILTAISTIFLLSMGLYVLFSKVRNPITLSFVFMALTFGLWSGSLLFYGNPWFLDSLNWLRVVYVIAHVGVLSLFLFAYYFPYTSRGSKWPFRFVLLLQIVTIPLIVALLWRTGYYVESVKMVEGKPEAIMGPFYLIYGIYIFLLPIAFSVYWIYRKFVESKGVHRLQVRTFLVTLPLLFLPIAILDVVLPVFFNNSRYYSYSPIALVPYVIGLMYTIFTQRLFGLRYLLGKVLIFFILAMFGLMYFNFLIWLYQLLWGDLFTLEAQIGAFFLAFIFVPMFLWVSKGLESFLRTKVVYVGFRPLEAIAELLKKTSTELDINKVVAHVISITKRTLNSDRAGIVLFDRESREVLYEKLSGFEENGKRKVRQLLEVVNLWNYQENLGRKSEILVKEEIERQIGLRKQEEVVRLKKVLAYMEEDKVEVILPLNRKVQLNGLMLVGCADERDPYASEQVDFLESVVANASVAVGRSMLYQEVREFSATLQERIEEATQELKKKNKQLSGTLEDLKELNQRERDMIDIMGHELRTPMSIIKNYFALLKKSACTLMQEKLGKEADKYVKYMDAIDENIEREVRLINTLLSSTKIDSGKLALNLEPLHIEELVETGVEGQLEEASRKGLVLEFKPPKEVIRTVYADSIRLQQIIDNLISNAVKYTDKGGIEITVEEDGDFAVVHIKDTGVGISPQDQKKLGKKFFRAEQYGGKKGDKDSDIIRPGGTGLGLYVTYELVKAHGGKIQVKSTVGKGTVFSFSVPLYNDQERVKKSPREGARDMFERLGLKK